MCGKKRCQCSVSCYCCPNEYWYTCKKCVYLPWHFARMLRKAVVTNHSCKFIFKPTHHEKDHWIRLMWMRPRIRAVISPKTGNDIFMHDDVIKWKHFPRYWPFVRGIHKGQWRGALVFSLISAWINGWVNNHEAGDLRRHRGHYDANVMVRYVHSQCFIFVVPVLCLD